MRPAVFLDRDDTLIGNRSVTAGTPHPGDLVDPSLVQLLPGVAEGCRRLREAGFALVAVSNQGCVARGVGTIAQVEAVNARMEELMLAGGVRLDRLYYCPYHPKGTVPPYNVEHPWRKPAPGMVLAAAREMGLDIGRSWMIGDAERDIQAGLAAGISSERAIMVGNRLSFAEAVAQVLRGG